MTTGGTNPSDLERIDVVDTHTGGEPTRVVFAGGPDLGFGSIVQRRDRLRSAFDLFRSTVVNEPRGSDVMVGALLCDPVAASSAAGVIFFNNVGLLGMCGHGTMGVAVALAHAGRIEAGRHVLETSVGDVAFQLHDDCARVTLENVASYLYARDVTIQLPDHGPVTGKVAWGGNWFFLVEDHGHELTVSRVGELTEFAGSIRKALARDGVRGKDGAEIDHIELSGPTENPNADSRNFVLCPGGAWDRSPCGTGTSARLACLAAEGQLRPGQIWRQESILGSCFDATYRASDDGTIIPSLTGCAWVTAESTLLLDRRDPFCTGIRL